MIQLSHPARLPVYDWAKAEKALTDAKEKIWAAAHLSRAGADIAYFVQVHPLVQRYAAGERTAELYEAMCGVEFRE